MGEYTHEDELSEAYFHLQNLGLDINKLKQDKVEKVPIEMFEDLLNMHIEAVYNLRECAYMMLEEASADEN